MNDIKSRGEKMFVSPQHPDALAELDGIVSAYFGTAGCRPTPMTHEEMAMRIGASRETVTRLISSLRRKRLIRLDGPMLVIKDRTALEALAV